MERYCKKTRLYEQLNWTLHRFILSSYLHYEDKSHREDSWRVTVTLHDDISNNSLMSIIVVASNMGEIGRN